MSGFHDQLDKVHGGEPELELFWTRRHHEWTSRLDGLGLDTELFRYQRAMNAGEGEAADAFAFSTDEAFVEFLLRAVLSEEEPKDLAEVVATYAHNLAQRGDLLSERDFVAGALDLLTPWRKKKASPPRHGSSPTRPAPRCGRWPVRSPRATSWRTSG